MVQGGRSRDVRTFTTGAACGFLAGVFSVCVVAWQLGRLPGTLPTGRPPVNVAAHQDEPGMDDAGAGVLEPSPEQAASTLGRERPVPAAPESPSSIGPTPGSSMVPASQMPVDGVRRSAHLQFADKRGGSRERAVDNWRRAMPGRAVGRTRARCWQGGGITIYQFDPSARYCYYYAHLELYATGCTGIRSPGQHSCVGTSGNAPRIRLTCISRSSATRSEALVGGHADRPGNILR
jgi:hypothetical protein